MRFRNLTVLLCFSMLFGLPVASPLFGDAVPYAPAEECAKCHSSIYKYWSESSHAKAVQSALFPVSLQRALALSADTTRTK